MGKKRKRAFTFSLNLGRYMHVPVLYLWSRDPYLARILRTCTGSTVKKYGAGCFRSIRSSCSGFLNWEISGG